MPDHDHEQAHDHDDDEPRRIAGILFSQMIGEGGEDPATRRQRRERHAAEHDDTKNRMFAALRSMSPEQLFMVRHMLITGMRSRKSLQWFDGIVNAIMQVQHGVDPDTGKTPEQMLLEHPVPRPDERLP